MRIGLAQINTTVGDIDGNTELIIDWVKKAKEQEVDLIAFPELSITGYPPLDLLFDHEFLRLNKAALNRIIDHSEGITIIVGFADFDDSWVIRNAAAVISNKRIEGIIHKTLLPTYDVFDEVRYFKPATIDEIQPVDINLLGEPLKVGIEICEDLWDDSYDIKVSKILCERGAQLIIIISASPFHVGKCKERFELIQNKARENGVPMFLANLIGGQDELVFDGQSLGCDCDGDLIAYGTAFEEELIVVDLDVIKGTANKVDFPPYDQDAEIFKALALGIRDYFRKTGFKRAVLGLSGGIDSSVTAAIAVEALGPENVIGISMPSRFSSDHSKSDAELLAENLGIKYLTIPIQEIVDQYHCTLDAPLEDLRLLFGVSKEHDDPVADENIQPRVRGNILMDISNRLRDLRILVLNTGNKTELALGYCTLYGDMTGGVGVIGDVSKLEVYRLAEYVNRRAGCHIIPRGSIEKRPSAELRPDQYDPFDFDIVSPMVDEIVENRRSKKELIEMGYPPDVVEDVYSRIRRAEYKRWQAPPCIKITKKAFGIGWKMPIVNGYRG